MATTWRSTRLAWLLPAGLLATATLASSQELAVREVRYWSLGDVTRIAIEATGDFTYLSDKLTNPDRVFFDLQGATLKLEGKNRGVRTIAVGDGIVRQIRMALTQPSVARVVLDLEGPASLTVSKLANPDRLMVEVRRAGPVPQLAAPASPATPRPVPSEPPAAAVKTVETRREAVRPQPKTPPPAAAPEPATAVMPPGSPAPEASTNPPAEPARVALPARRNRDGNRSLTRVLGLKLGKVVIDAGHGGHDAGTIGPSGLAEKDLVLDIALRLGELIETRLGSEVLYTRKDDRFLPLEERTAYANGHRADLFLSIHANASPYQAASGVETYYLNFTDSKVDLEVAARENAGHEKSIYELQDLIQKIALKDKLAESREFATRVQTALFPLSLKLNPRARNRGVKKAPFIVLIGASMPSILTEIGFVSNPKEEALLRTGEHRQRIADALFKGVAQYAATLSHYTVAQSQSIPGAQEE
ncbi:MAG: N-acetylmuramoyl-L-alanine amidase [Bryobacteraceae bacterium]|nr:N-acetylmuramoyl-L-alanine amidase [Bryobacteraceae bacterium]